MTNAHQVTGKRVKEYPIATGRNDGLCQDYNGNLGRWFADRLSARNDLRRSFDMTKDIDKLNAVIKQARDALESFKLPEDSIVGAQSGNLILRVPLKTIQLQADALKAIEALQIKD